MHFRDPKVWRQGGKWWMVVESKRLQDHGQILLFKSTDLLNWDQNYQVLAKTDDNNVYMWECPDFFPLGEQFLPSFHLKEKGKKLSVSKSISKWLFGW